MKKTINPFKMFGSYIGMIVATLLYTIKRDVGMLSPTLNKIDDFVFNTPIYNKIFCNVYILTQKSTYICGNRGLTFFGWIMITFIGLIVGFGIQLLIRRFQKSHKKP